MHFEITGARARVKGLICATDYNKIKKQTASVQLYRYRCYRRRCIIRLGGEGGGGGESPEANSFV